MQKLSKKENLEIVHEFPSW